MVASLDKHMPPSWSDNLRHIVIHIGSTLIIELGLGAVAWFGHLVLEDGFILTALIKVDEYAMLGVAIWLVRNLAIHLWNNRERLGGPHVVLA